MSSNSTISQQLAEFIYATSFGDLPPAVVEMAKSRVLDSLATGIASRNLQVPKVALQFVKNNRGEATIFGHAQRLPAIDGGAGNGTLVNGTTQDDFLAKSHAGAVVILPARPFRGGSMLWAGVPHECRPRLRSGSPSLSGRPWDAAQVSGVGCWPGCRRCSNCGKATKTVRFRIGECIGTFDHVCVRIRRGFHAGTMDVKLNVGWSLPERCLRIQACPSRSHLCSVSVRRKVGIFQCLCQYGGKSRRGGAGTGEAFPH